MASYRLDQCAIRKYSFNIQSLQRSSQYLSFTFACLVVTFLLLTWGAPIVSSPPDTITPTSNDYIAHLIERKTTRSNISNRLTQLEIYANSLFQKHKIARLQHNSLLLAANVSIIKTSTTNTTNSNDTSVFVNGMNLVSDRAFNKAITKNLHLLQSLTNIKTESTIINAAIRMQNKVIYEYFNSLLNGMDKTMNSSLIPIPLSEPLLNGSLSYFNVNSTSFNLKSPSTATNRERTFMCSGDSFGIYIDPTTGALYSWGTNTLGRSSTSPLPQPVEINLSSNEYIKQVACGSQHALVLTNSAIYSWGVNNNGECGIENQKFISLPLKIKTHSNSISYINAGPYNSVYIDITGVAFSWGRGLECQLGGGFVATSSSVPVQIQHLNFTKICFGRNHAVGRTTTGLLYYWGQRLNQEGYDSHSIPTELYTYNNSTGSIIFNQCTPTKFTSDFFTFYGSSIVDFQCGSSSTLALLNTGRIFGWGNNTYGQLGTDSISNINPLAVSFENIGPSRKIVKIFHKNEQSFGIADDQTVWAWGRNDDNVCNLATGRLNSYICYWGQYCRSICAAQVIPESLNKAPIYDYVHEIHIMKESSIMVYTYEKEMGFYAGGLFSTSLFRNGYRGLQNFYSKVHIFDIDYIVPYQKYFPALNGFNIRIIFSENNFLSVSPENIDMITIYTSNMTVTIGKVTMEMFGAYSFFNTHDFSIDSSVYYFGGFVNNKISDRIILKTSIDTVQIFNESLPYPVAGGMLVIVDDYLYIFGGLTYDRGEMIPTYKVMRCKLTNILVWEEVLQILPHALYNGVAQVFGDNIYIFGGRTGTGRENADILYASVFDMIWKNSYRTLPYPYSESNLFTDNNYIYMTGGFGPTYSLMKGISRALKSDPLSWEDLGQNLPMSTLGITSTLIWNNKLYLISIDFPQNFLTGFLNVPITIHSIYVSNKSEPYIAPTIENFVNITLKVLDNAFIFGTVLRSCREYKDFVSTAENGVYWIKPSEKLPKFKVYCDMINHKGGLTLVSTRLLSAPIPISSTDYVKPDFSGNTITDDKWAALRSISSDLIWKDVIGYYAVASIEFLSTPSTYVCKTLSTSLLNSELFRMQDRLPCNYGADSCQFGLDGASASLKNNCGYNMYAITPFKSYNFLVPNYRSTGANIFIR